MKRFGLILLSGILAVSLSACGSASYDYSSTEASTDMSYDLNSKTSSLYYDTDGATEESEVGYASSSGTYVSATTESSSEFTIQDSETRKLIKTYNIDLETKNFDELLNTVNSKISSLGGYLQNIDTYNGSSYSSYSASRSSNMTVRIPSDKLEEFVNFVGEAANITSKSLSVEDVTLQYVDNESRKETYEIEEERLLAMLEKCETVEDMISIESRLSDVRYNIESLESTLRTYDNLVDYSTVYLYINEVKELTEPEPEGFFSELGSSFKDGLESALDGLADFVLWLANALPTLVIFAIVIVIIVLIIKAISKKKKKSNEKKTLERAEKLMNEAISTAQENAKKNE